MESENVKCPYCNSTNVKKYLYGMPTHDYDKDKYILGGCEVTLSNPKYKCMDCGKDIFYEDLNKEDYIKKENNN